MSAVSIDRLQINIESESVSAVTAIEDLLRSLGKLQAFTLGNGIASSIRDIGNAAKQATKGVKKMGDAFASASKYAMTLKNFQWEFGKQGFMNNGEGVFNTRLQIGMDVDPNFQFPTAKDIIDVPYQDITPIGTEVQDVTESFFSLRDIFVEVERHMAELDRMTPLKHFKQKIQEATKAANSFFKSIQRIATYRLIRSALKAITSGLREGIQNLAQYSKAIGETDTWAANSVMSEYATKFLEVKNAVGAAAMPVLVALQPVIISIANAFIYATNALNMFFSALGGSGTYTKAQTAAVDYAATLDKSSAGASKAAKELSAGFDELNVLSDNSGSGGGGGSTNGMPDFKDMFSENMIPKWLIDNLQLIKDLVIAIGIGLLAWKIASLFTDDLSKIAGLALAAVGAFLLIKGAVDAWTNGVNWTNAIEMIAGTAIAAIALGLAFNGVVGAVMLLIGGIAMLVVGIKDWITTGQLSTETFALLEAGIIAVGVALAILCGPTGWIPLIVAAVAALALAVYKYSDEIKAFVFQCLETVKVYWEVFKTFLSTIWENIKQNLTAKWNAIKSFFITVTDNIKTNLETKWNAVKNFFATVTANIKANLEEKWNAVKSFFTTLWINIKANIEEKWNAIKTFFNVIIPNIINNIVKFFGELPGKIKEKIDKVKETISNWATDAIGWIKIYVPKVINSVVDWFAKIPTALVEVGKNMIKALWNGILSMGNWLWDKVTGFLGDLGEFAEEIFGDFGGGSAEVLGAVPRYASGGIVEGSGQLFLARENGAELVGNIGGSTAVMNNDQIVAAVSGGVYNAVLSAMSQTNGKAQSIQVFLDGKQIEASTRDTKQRRGATIATSGVFNYA